MSRKTIPFNLLRNRWNERYRKFSRERNKEHEFKRTTQNSRLNVEHHAYNLTTTVTENIISGRDIYLWNGKRSCIRMQAGFEDYNSNLYSSILSVSIPSFHLLVTTREFFLLKMLKGKIAELSWLFHCRLVQCV